MSDAIHEGLRESGLVPNMKWVVEMEESYLDIAFEGSSSWSDETKALALPLQELAFGGFDPDCTTGYRICERLPGGADREPASHQAQLNLVTLTDNGDWPEIV